MPSAPTPEAPLLALSEVRVDVDGIAVIDGLSLTSTGEWVLVLGAPRALFEAAAGLRATARGTLLVAGVSATTASRTGVATGAPLDPPLPPRWTVRDYVQWSARLAGHPAGLARALAGQALERLQLAPYASLRLGPAALTVRRGVVIAAALASGAGALLVEDPTVGLADDVAHAFARAIAGALRDVRVAFFAARAPLESPLALAADESIVLHGDSLAAQGAPAEIATAARAFALAVTGNVNAFVDALRAEGGVVVAPPAASPAPPFASAEAPAPAAHLAVDLGPLATRDLFRLALRSNATVLELRPLAGTFA